ncbi:hypothetical protein BJV74DRAFT_989633 [Russula compacta]|nr:hypothetical protein BJV74DRAFT_989633 [Russula compacta]
MAGKSSKLWERGRGENRKGEGEGANAKYSVPTGGCYYYRRRLNLLCFGVDSIEDGLLGSTLETWSRRNAALTALASVDTVARFNMSFFSMADGRPQTNGTRIVTGWDLDDDDKLKEFREHTIRYDVVRKADEAGCGHATWWHDLIRPEESSHFLFSISQTGTSRPLARYPCAFSKQLSRRLGWRRWTYLTHQCSFVSTPRDIYASRVCLRMIAHPRRQVDERVHARIVRTGTLLFKVQEMRGRKWPPPAPPHVELYHFLTCGVAMRDCGVNSCPHGGLETWSRRIADGDMF